MCIKNEDFSKNVQVKSDAIQNEFATTNFLKSLIIRKNVKQPGESLLASVRVCHVLKFQWFTSTASTAHLILKFSFPVSSEFLLQQWSSNNKRLLHGSLLIQELIHLCNSFCNRVEAEAVKHPIVDSCRKMTMYLCCHVRSGWTEFSVWEYRFSSSNLFLRLIIKVFSVSRVCEAVLALRVFVYSVKFLMIVLNYKLMN